MSSLIPLFGILVVARLLQVGLLRYIRAQQIEDSFGSRYALTPQDEKIGKPRMNSREAGHRGVRDAQRIFSNLGSFEMPFVTQKALEFVRIFQNAKMRVEVSSNSPFSIYFTSIGSLPNLRCSKYFENPICDR